MNNLVSRVITGLVAAPLILALLYWLPWYGWGALAGAALLVGAYEFFALSHPDDQPGRYAGIALTAALYGAILWTDFGTHHSGVMLAAFAAVVPAALLFTLFRPGDQKTALLRMAALAMGPMYLGTSVGASVLLHKTGGGYVGPGLVVFSLMVAWFGDTGGYFAGKGIGGPKLYPSVSPGKTWAGAIGGLFGSAVGALMASLWYLQEMTLVKGLIAAVVAGAAGQMGDLCESLMKRSANVKDSGAILPGHGGILDRLDALFFVSLILYVMLRSGWLLTR